MQVINLDLSVKGIVPLLQAKQGDVGRKFQAVITDGGTAYDIPSGTNLSVWYSGTSGEGNYSHIGLDDDFLQSRSAFTISGNTVTVELVAQMLTCAGGGTLSLVMNGADGTQIATWNIPYIVEKMPGANSEGATQYYTAYAEVAMKEMSSALINALEYAKISGEFDGPQGEKGEKGDPGAQGPKGEDGTMTFEELTEAQKESLKGEKGDPGEAGKDGVSAAHSWNGTTLTITSASGTSSANLKGDKGDKGEQGIQGIQGEKGEKGDPGERGATGATGATGADGYSPVKGVDYFTDTDKAAMVQDVLAALPYYDGSVTITGGAG